jgi:D-serine deaminase-like pyridoxal phosphate-dependent protein
MDELLANSSEQLMTPCAILDVDAMRLNIHDTIERIRGLGVTMRPHLKTCKSLRVADEITGGRMDHPITVSTLAEVAYFFEHGGYTDILYAVGMDAHKVRSVVPFARKGLRLKIITDNAEAVLQVAEACKRHNVQFDVLIEVDCGDGRGGLSLSGEDLLAVAAAIRQTENLRLVGVLTHGGHSYRGEATAVALRRVACAERDAVVLAANRLRNAGHDISIVSAGSTPTLSQLDSAAGLTEIRAGVFVFQDLDQLRIGSCPSIDRIAVTVLTTVIGFTSNGNVLVDAGGLALSKDLSAAANKDWITGYGWVAHHPGLYVSRVSQEHGVLAVKTEGEANHVNLRKLLPVGSRVRIIPHHACFTAAAYDEYVAVRTTHGSIERWPRINGWDLRSVIDRGVSKL